MFLIVDYSSYSSLVKNEDVWHTLKGKGLFTPETDGVELRLGGKNGLNCCNLESPGDVEHYQ